MALRRELPVRFRQNVADGAALPFASDSFDLILLVDVLEHLPDAAGVANEIMRVLRPGGRCVVITPARAPLLFRRDPHYGIRGLLLLPNEVQRILVDRVFRRGGNPYDVEHTFWSAGEIARLFPGPKTVDVVYETWFAPPGPFTVRWLARPRTAVEHFRYRLRHLAYGPIIVHKGTPDAGAPVFERM
jgi:SAM-dependent methyltransferase